MFWNPFLQEFLLGGPFMHAWDSAQGQCKILFSPQLTPTWLQLQWAERRSSSNTNKNITEQLLSHILEWLHLFFLMYVHLCLFLLLCTPLHRYCWHWRCSLRKWWHMLQAPSRNQLEGKGVSLTGPWLRDGKQSTFLWAQDSDTWAAPPAPAGRQS